MRRWIVVAALALVPAVAHADKTKKTAGDAAKTGVDAVIDGGRLVGRTTRALFKSGTGAAKKTARQNARTTAADARANARATRAAAHEK